MPKNSSAGERARIRALQQSENISFTEAQRRLRAIAASRKAQAEGSSAYLLRPFAGMVPLPVRNPGASDQLILSHNNRQVILRSEALVDDAGTTTVPGLPYGTLARLVLVWMCTEAVRTGSPELHPGPFFSRVTHELGLRATGGVNGSIYRIRDQLTRLTSLSVDIDQAYDCRPVTPRWTVATPECRNSGWSHDLTRPAPIRLSQEFFEKVTTDPVCLDWHTIKQFPKGPLHLDAYFRLAAGVPRALRAIDDLGARSKQDEFRHRRIENRVRRLLAAN